MKRDDGWALHQQMLDPSVNDDGVIPKTSFDGQRNRAPDE
jgi:hypothetical protein